MTNEASTSVRTPSEKMIAAAKAAATRHKVELPANFEKDSKICGDFLSEYLNKPTEKAISYAENIAKSKSLTLPDNARTSSRDLSAWIDANR